MNKNIIKKIKTSPQTPGVYLFYKKNQLLYIGKAANLKSRLQNYLKITDHKTGILNQDATRLQIIKLSSPIEALIEESRLIKKLKPQLNVYWSDDKQYFYVAFTRETFPKIFITHQPQLETRNSKLETLYIGPFTDGHALKLILRQLRRRYPHCSCKNYHFRHCLNYQIGLCLGFCCVHKNNVKSQENLKKYQSNIKIIKAILSGQKPKLLKTIINPESHWAADIVIDHRPHLQNIKNQPANPFNKMECYDISNLSGQEAVGALTTLNQTAPGDWQPDKNQFRKFKIKNPNTRDDPKMIAEILERRLNHPEWPYPDLIIIDGGITQYRAAQKILETRNLKLKTISFAKPKKEIIGLKEFSKTDRHAIENLKKTGVIEQIIQQTHNFAIRYHRHLRSKIMLN